MQPIKVDDAMNRANSNTLHWMAITFVLFPILILLGIFLTTRVRS